MVKNVTKNEEEFEAGECCKLKNNIWMRDNGCDFQQLTGKDKGSLNGFCGCYLVPVKIKVTEVSKGNKKTAAKFKAGECCKLKNNIWMRDQSQTEICFQQITGKDKGRVVDYVDDPDETLVPVKVKIEIVK